MGYSNQFFEALGLSGEFAQEIKSAAEKTGIPVARLNHYNESNTLPSGEDLRKIEEHYGVSELQLKLKTGRIDREALALIQAHSEDIFNIIAPAKELAQHPNTPVEPVMTSALGKLYQQDCLTFLHSVESDSVDLVFADPPFNLDKLYPSNMDDNIREEEYLSWTEHWLKECIRVLGHGGALFIWNLPLWNSTISTFLHGRLTFKHWISVDIKYSLPIKGRLYPSHYSLLYFVKGEKPNKLIADRLPTQTCPSCFDNLKDYGGYKHKMNPQGISLTDVWTDIPPVRHAKYKKRAGANELPVKLLDRIIEMSTNPGDTVLDPFGGSGTTFVVAELKGRRWMGCEIGPCDDIINRFESIEEDKHNLEGIRSNLNHLYTPLVKKEREARGLWTAESAATKHKAKTDALQIPGGVGPLQ
ncbi:DNA methyltransferase [Pseudomonas sp. SLFW]|uniref:DNA methyltransferase n=1 Tax=Pseudomonas sp. SLFW TaxID=2683259 RepID=UPI00141244A9|nr:DNA methyltransferase [Pseudomonas sp. SLFW]NBB12134.1 site-specific DNA-methyltransferase [Pseudomonas sp. SLFW]